MYYEYNVLIKINADLTPQTSLIDVVKDYFGLNKTYINSHRYKNRCIMPYGAIVDVIDVELKSAIYNTDASLNLDIETTLILYRPAIGEKILVASTNQEDKKHGKLLEPFDSFVVVDEDMDNIINTVIVEDFQLFRNDKIVISSRLD